MYKQEVEAWIGGDQCVMKTLSHNHLYCEPPATQPSITANRKQDGLESLPEFIVSETERTGVTVDILYILPYPGQLGYSTFTSCLIGR